ncbi:MAG: hypothetical protein K2F94_10150 [Muribaculaceae bacterium]|nr:hypothetical protein [Muribaculaceae bacterium]MDE6399875.1 hypothetical protein [Muribaculaceae bacterium]MDE6533815.1 hypothetical protein [Muribaculaceae bacterium]
MKIEDIKKLPAEEAVAALDQYISINPQSDEAFFIRGMRHWALSHRSLAINDYLAAIRINPESPAVEALRNANDILDYYNPDLINP